MTKEKSKKRKLDSEDCDDENITTVTNDIRKKVIKWSREKYEKALVESEDFILQVQRDTLNSKQMTASIRCLKCGNSQKINRKQTGNNPWQLSNFTKHYISCNKSSKRKMEKAENIQNFFPVVTQERLKGHLPSIPIPTFSAANPYFLSPFTQGNVYGPAATNLSSFPSLSFTTPLVTPTPNYERDQLPGSSSEYRSSTLPVANIRYASLDTHDRFYVNNQVYDTAPSTHQSWDNDVDITTMSDSSIHLTSNSDDNAVFENPSQNINTQSSEQSSPQVAEVKSDKSTQGFH